MTGSLQIFYFSHQYFNFCLFERSNNNYPYYNNSDDDDDTNINNKDNNKINKRD